MRAGETQVSAAFASVKACVSIDAVIIEVAQRFQPDALDLLCQVAARRLWQPLDHIIECRDLKTPLAVIVKVQIGLVQLVAVARAIVASPKVILADEPTGNLHSEQGRQIMELFKKLNEQGTTIIQVTHSDVNATYGNRVINLADGWVVE